MERAGYVVFNIETETFRPANDQLTRKKRAGILKWGRLLKIQEAVLDGQFNGRLNRGFPSDDHAESVKKELLYPYPYPEQEGKGKAVFEDKDGNIWYGTSTQGVIRFQPDFEFIRLYKKGLFCS